MENRHGFDVKIDKVDNNIFLSMKAIGKLTHSDYETMTPILESLLKDIKEPKIKVLIDFSEFEGWELRAAWDDLKIGVEHNFKFEKIAILGNHKRWLEYGIKISNWFTHGEMREFNTYKDAINWLNS